MLVKVGYEVDAQAWAGLQLQAVVGPHMLVEGEAEAKVGSRVGAGAGPHMLVKGGSKFEAEVEAKVG